jgi:hypothetical protein
MNLVSFLFCGFFVVLAHTWHFLAGLALLGVGCTGIGKCLPVNSSNFRLTQYIFYFSN